MQHKQQTVRAILAMAGMVGAMAVSAFGQGVGPGGKGPGVDRLGDLDANDDGTITAAELAAAGEARVAELQANFLAKYDSVPAGQTAGDGIITLAESTAVFEEQAADWLEHVLATFDTNKDGAISDADATAGSRRRPGRHHLEGLDTNDDGVVSAAELEAAAKEQVADRLARFLERYDSVPEGATAGDGIIAAAESLAVHREQVAEQVEAFLERHDANDDGQVTAAELGAVKGNRPGGRPGGPGGRR